jgi:guanylate kinase
MAIFLLPPDFQIWQKRLQNRYGDVVDATDSRRRLQTALEEIEQLLNTNYYTALINDDLQKTFEAVQAITKSKTHKATHDSLAREVAKHLASDIQAHLGDT